MLRFFADTDCDVTLEIAKKYGCDLVSFPYEMKGELVYPYVDFEEFNDKEYYSILRGGYIPSTSALNEYDWTKAFEPAFAAGDDIIYFHYSRNLSASFNMMDKAVADLLAKYPGRKFYGYDTKSMTIGALAMIIELLELWKAGKSAEELLAAADEICPKYATYFFSDDLKFFRKSGRVSNFSGILGNLVGIKPIIYMSEQGTMENIGKIRGTKNAINTILNHFDELKAPDFKNHKIVIGHGDSPELVEKMAATLKEKYGDDLDIMVCPVNPTAGAHCGPDTIGITFYAIHR
ncbi:MAG: DegV family protein [Bacilli bacterium]|nr:DegV family protein [Bacilli bacterium]